MGDSPFWRALGWQVVAAAMAGLVGLVDYVTGSELSLGLLYLIAVAIAAWKVGRSAGITLAILCAAIWFTADRAGGHQYSHPFIPYWNALIRLGFFAVVAGLLASLRQALSRELAAARVDSVTGAANRRCFLERLEDELERCKRYDRPLTLAYIDLDHFKQVNDHLGHAAGDRVLSVVAATLSGRMRKTDTVARFGGDEFAVLLPETGTAAAESAIGAARDELLERMGDYGWPVTFSIGAVTSSGEVGVEALIHQADELMYRVKREGKNRILYAEFSG